MAAEHKMEFDHDDDDPFISGLGGQHDPEFLIPDQWGGAAERRHKDVPDVDDAVDIIENSKEPFWGKLIKKLYLDGFSIEQMEEAFILSNMQFKWTGQICIWFQESTPRPTCVEQMRFAAYELGERNTEHCRSVIQRLIESNCAEIEPEPEPLPQEQSVDQPPA